jgi:hypothetical protein
MRFDRAFQVSSVLLAATAFVGLVLAHGVPLWLTLLTAATFVVALHREWKETGEPNPSDQPIPLPKLWNLLLIGAFGLFLLDLFLLSGDLLSAGVHFLVVLLAIKLCTLRQAKDYRHLSAISLMAILASAALTIDLWYLPVFLLYLLGVVWTLLLDHLAHQQRVPVVTGQPTASMFSQRITPRFFWLTNGMAIATCALTLMIFFVLPRIGVGMMQKTRGEGLKTTGFSERVDLGTIGSIKQDPQIVMRVELPDQPASGRDRLYLRGLAYDRYDGRAWHSSSTYRRHLGLSGENTFVVNPAAGRTNDGSSPPFQQDILLEALDTAVLFAAPFAESLSGELGAVQVDSMGGLRLPYQYSSRLRYSVVSREHRVTPEEQLVSAIDYPRSIQDRYVQVPPFTPRVAELAKRLVQRAATPYEQVSAIQQHLMQNYQYSLDIETTLAASPVEEFLFGRKAGYCEHYATAMGMLLRSIGIPARLVTGFLATEWNDFGGYFTVRQRDAHAWVEVYFPRSGWITFDPTPASGAAAVGSRWDALYRLSELLRLQWDRVFIRYSARDQLAVVQGLRENSDVLRERLSAWISAVSTPINKTVSRLVESLQTIVFGMREFVIGSCVAGLAVLLLTIRDRLAIWATTHMPRSRRHPAVSHLYTSMLRVLAKHEMVKSPAATPREFARQIEREWKTVSPIVENVTNLYYYGRYGGATLSQDELLRAMQQIRQLPRLLQTTR